MTLTPGERPSGRFRIRMAWVKRVGLRLAGVEAAQTPRSNPGCGRGRGARALIAAENGIADE